MNAIKHKFRFFYFTFFEFCKITTLSNTKIPRNEIKKMIDEKDAITKKQIKSSGPGGQHVNKTSSAVLLRHSLTNIQVKAQDSRDSDVNYGKAKKRLIDKLDLHYNGKESKISKSIEKKSKQKERNKRRSVEKHQNNKCNNPSI